MAKELPAEPHVLFSFINRGAGWPEVIKELVDNSLDDAAGDAQHVLIQIEDDAITVWDNGCGIADINALGTLGRSGSFHFEGNIGQYGVGAKLWLCKAGKLHVQTVRNGKLHQHTFNAHPVITAIKNKRTPPWLNAYEGNGVPSQKKNHTMVRMTDLRDKPRILLPTLKLELEKTYWPGLRSGRTIMLEDSRKRATTKGTYDLELLTPPNWTDAVEFESAVAGKRYKARIGILGDSIGAYSGIWIGFLFRNICVEKTLLTRIVPPRIHGQIELSNDWRHCLSNYKNSIIEDRDALLFDIENRAKEILDLAEAYAEDIQLEKISAEIEGNVSLALMEAIAARKKRTSGSGGGIKSEPDPDNPIPEIKSKDEDEDGDTKKTETKAVVSGIKLKWDDLGDGDIFSVGAINKTIEVTLNKKCPKLAAQRQLPRYPGIYMAIGTALAFHCQDQDLSTTQIQELFGGMLGDADGSESREKMMRAILVWWGFVVAEQHKDQEVA